MVKVALLGAAGGIGYISTPSLPPFTMILAISQPLALLLKQNHHVTHLALYDLVAVPGVAADLSHVNTLSTVTGHLGDTKDASKDKLHEALTGAHIVVITAGVARKPGMTRDDLFNINAGIISNIANNIAKYCPSAFVCVITNPVNSTVPIVAEVLKSHGVYDPRRLFGVTTLDVVRAATFLSDALSSSGTLVDPAPIRVPVVGGHSGTTIVPLFSQATGVSSTSVADGSESWRKLVNRVQFGGDEVVKAKDGAGSATLSMAYAGARFVVSLIEAMRGVPNVVEPTYVQSDVFASEGVSFFASNVTLGKEGVQQVHGIGQITAAEQELVKAAVQELKGNIQKGVDFVKAKANI